MASIDQELDRIFGSKSSPTQAGMPVEPNQSQENLQANPDVLSAIDSVMGRASQPVMPDISIEENQDLSIAQNLILSFSANDERRIQFLQEQFPENQVGLDDQGNIIIDDKRINPRGFDIGDIGRNAGYAFNLGGQILGSLKGASIGTVGGPVGIRAGLIAGGTIGGSVGEAIRLGVGEAIGLDQTEKEVLSRIAEEAVVSGTGEAIGLATLGAGNIVARGPVGKTVSSLWRKTIDAAKKLKLPVEDILKYTSNIDEDATRIAIIENKPSQVLNAEYFNQDKGMQIAKNTLFGKESNQLAPMQLDNLKNNGFTRGQEMLIKSIKQSNNEGLDNLYQRFGNIDNEAMQIIKGSNIDDLLKSENLSDDAYLRIAEDVANNLNKRREDLGKALEIKTDQAKGTFNFDDVALQAAQIAKPQLDNIIQKQGFQPKKLPDVKGYKELEDLMESFFGIKIGTVDGQIIDSNGQVILRAAKPTKRPFGDLSKKDVLKLNNSIDNQISTIVTNDNIPPSIRDAANEIRKSFKDSYYRQLNLGAESQAFADFARLTDDIQTNGRNAIVNLANTLKGSSQTGILGRADIINALNGVRSGLGESLLAKTARISTAQRISKKVSASKLLENFEKQISRKQILSSIKSGSQTNESILRSIDNSIKLDKNPEISSRAFFNESQKFLAAQEFNKNTANMLRMQTVLGVMGITSLPFGLGIGGIAGIAASQLTNPKFIAKMLVAAEKKTSKKTLQESAKTIASKLRVNDIRKTAKDPRTKALLKSLLSRQLGNKTDKKQNPNK